MKIMTIFDPGDFAEHGGLLSVDINDYYENGENYS